MNELVDSICLSDIKLLDTESKLKSKMPCSKNFSEQKLMVKF